MLKEREMRHPIAKGRHDAERVRSRDDRLTRLRQGNSRDIRKVTDRNLLGQETSPYLLQHAENPVHWHPWGAEALAGRSGATSPILLSIGYAACHWCHVMAHESFEDAETAALMNELFVNIKVDREERPDIDHIYMSRAARAWASRAAGR